MCFCCWYVDDVAEGGLKKGVAGIRIVRWNAAGFEEVRRSGRVMSEVARVGHDIASRAGRGYVVSTQQGVKGPSPAWNKKRGPGYQGRARAIVYPATFRAMRDNAKNNTLVKLMGGPGGF